jgi:hypothetical protein
MMRLGIIERNERDSFREATPCGPVGPIGPAGDNLLDQRRIQSIERLATYFGHRARAAQYIASGASAQSFATLCVSLGRSIRE